MLSESRTYRVFAGTAVLSIFVFVLAVWLILETGWLPESLYTPLYPIWFPTYLAFAAASGVRNVFPSLGSEFLFNVAVLLSIYLEAVLLAGFVRTTRRLYRTYRQGEKETAK